MLIMPEFKLSDNIIKVNLSLRLIVDCEYPIYNHKSIVHFFNKDILPKFTYFKFKKVTKNGLLYGIEITTNKEITINPNYLGWSMTNIIHNPDMDNITKDVLLKVDFYENIKPKIKKYCYI